MKTITQSRGSPPLIGANRRGGLGLLLGWCLGGQFRVASSHWLSFLGDAVEDRIGEGVIADDLVPVLEQRLGRRPIQAGTVPDAGGWSEDWGAAAAALPMPVPYGARLSPPTLRETSL